MPGQLDGKKRRILFFDLWMRDSTAETDMNVVMVEGGGLVEVQGTAERRPFEREDLERMLDLSAAAINKINELQRKVLEV